MPIIFGVMCKNMKIIYFLVFLVFQASCVWLPSTNDPIAEYYANKNRKPKQYYPDIIGTEQPPIDTCNYFKIDSLPKIGRKTKLKYPKKMLNESIEGYVEVGVIINTMGIIDYIDIIYATNIYFQEEAIKTLQENTHVPGIENGKKVRCYLKTKLRYNLR